MRPSTPPEPPEPSDSPSTNSPTHSDSATPTNSAARSAARKQPASGAEGAPRGGAAAPGSTPRGPRRRSSSVFGWPRAIRDAGRAGLRVERASLNPLLALRGAAGVAVILALTLWWGSPGLAVSSAFGAFASGIATFQRSFHPRPALALAAALGLSVSAFLGYVLAGNPPAFLCLLALWAFGAGMAWTFGAVPGVVGAFTVAMMLVVVTLPATVWEALQHASLIALGGVVQAGLIVIFPVRRWGAQRDALADALAGVADYARQLREEPTLPFDPEPLMWARTAARLTPGQARRRPAQLSGYRTLAERFRAVLAALADPLGGVPDYGPERERVRDLLRAAGTVLDAVARAVRRGETPTVPASALEVLRVPADGPVLPPGPARKAALRLIALTEEAVDAAGGPLEVTDRSGEHRVRDRFGPGVVRVAARAVRRELRLDSPVFRHALRLAAVIVAGWLLGEVLPSEHGYWIALTIVTVLRPDFTDTVGRGAARLVGTIVGVATAGLVLALSHPGLYLAAGWSLLSVFLLYLLIRTGFTVVSACAGAYVVFLLGIAGQDWAQTVPERIELTLVGGLLALVSYALFPSWETPRLRVRLGDWLAAAATYAATVLTDYADPNPNPRTEQRARQALLDVRAARMEWEQTTDRAAAEPVRARGLSRRAAADAHDSLITAGRAASLLESQLAHHAGSFALSEHSGESAMAHDPGAEQFARVLLAAAEPAAQAVREGRTPDWTEVQHALEEWRDNTEQPESIALRVAELVTDSFVEVATVTRGRRSPSPE
ncbi:FUSC family protein [Streptomyces sp. XM4193]|uniref:FUSC family protein n=1 Tax=Streptomyces sp. XM4193 TaxID=2929782 RepID=UPI001FF92861|nr:FUSC family protein [Streptomyces sp. XM4193]MCK1798613.1 FUSC family protein [Streptomyces sp. XM4193]